MRRRGKLNKIGMLAIALIVALGAVGVTYGAWVDEIYIEGTISTSGINAELSCGDCWIDPDNPETGISCTGTGMTRTVSVSNALLDTNYYCDFTVSNIDIDPLDEFESIPIKIESVTFAPVGTYDGITGTVSVSPVGTVLDPGQSAGGTVQISVASDATQYQNPAFTLTVTVVRWNE